LSVSDRATISFIVHAGAAGFLNFSATAEADGNFSFFDNHWDLTPTV